MSKFLFKNLNFLTIIRPRASFSLASSNTHNLFDFFLESNTFSCSLSSSSVEIIEKSSKRTEFTVDYLIKSCGFTPERAISASKYVKLKVADNPDSVLTFLKDHGFNNTQISKMIHLIPPLLLSNPQKSLLPKIEFFKSKGVSGQDIVEVISKQPRIFRRSLEDCLIPSFKFFSSFLQSDEKTVAAFKRFARAFWFTNVKDFKVNIEMLKQIGVPDKNIGYFLTSLHKSLLIRHDRFKQIVEDVKKFGFNPVRLDFLIAIHALNSMSKTTWDRKVKVYKKWGWSEDDVVSAFRKSPWCMIKSEDKINSVMEFWVSKMGWKSSLLANTPPIMSYSLEKRIAPRCEVYQIFGSNGLLNQADSSLGNMLYFSENLFIEKFVNPYKEQAPNLLKLYKQKVGS